MKTSGTTIDIEWQPETTNDNEWQRVKTSYKKWQQMTTSVISAKFLFFDQYGVYGVGMSIFKTKKSFHMALTMGVQGRVADEPSIPPSKHKHTRSISFIEKFFSKMFGHPVCAATLSHSNA